MLCITLAGKFCFGNSHYIWELLLYKIQTIKVDRVSGFGFSLKPHDIIMNVCPRE